MIVVVSFAVVIKVLVVVLVVIVAVVYIVVVIENVFFIKHKYDFDFVQNLGHLNKFINQYARIQYFIMLWEGKFRILDITPSSVTEWKTDKRSLRIKRSM